jgi:CubicO group peptidase (beta-lactamase class C family)
VKTSKRIFILSAAAALLLTGLFTGCGRTVTAQSDTSGTSSAAPASSAQQDENVTKTHTYSGFSEAAGDIMREITDSYGAAAVQLALLDGEDIKTFCCGYADLDTLRPVTDATKYRVASLSKLVVAAVFMKAAAQGYVDENEDISVYFGEECRNPRYPDTVITPSMLMAHTSSLAVEKSYIYYEGLFSERDTYLPTQPGTEYEYSNFGYCVLACLTERATGRSLSELAQEYLFAPLGIDASFEYAGLQDTSDVGDIYGEGDLSAQTLSGIESKGLGVDLSLGAGNLIISAKDYVKLLGVLIHEGNDVDGEAVLSAGTVEEMLAVRASQPGFDVAYGSQIQTDVIEGKTVYVHTGSAYGLYAAYVFDPVTKRAAVVLTTGEERLADDNGVYALCLDLIREIWDT